MKTSFLDQVCSAFSSDFMTQSPEKLEHFGRDWTRVFLPSPSAVVFPRTTDEVARFLRLCSQERIAVVPSGGRTGLAGGAVAAHGEVVLSLDRMNRMEPVDTLASTVKVQAGAITEAVHLHCLPHLLTWPIDFASKGSSQVGGNISTNAGGVKVIRYGLTRQWVLGLQVVTMQGDILELNGALEKNNTGLDMRQIFIGSEGTLGVVTEATLKLAPLPKNLEVFFFALEDIDAVLRLFQEARRSGFQIMAFEFLTRNCFELVSSSRGLTSPFQKSYPAYVLMEIERLEGEGPWDRWLEAVFEKEFVLDGTVAQSPREAKELWSFREGISESLSLHGFVHKNDIAISISQLGSFVQEMYSLFMTRNPGLEIFLFGHIGDGNLHVNTLKPNAMNQEEFVQLCHETDFELFTLVKKYAGSISAEHGIGLLKKDALPFSRSSIELELMRGFKRLLDPQKLLNPGKIFD